MVKGEYCERGEELIEMKWLEGYKVILREREGGRLLQKFLMSPGITPGHRVKAGVGGGGDGGSSGGPFPSRCHTASDTTTPPQSSPTPLPPNPPQSSPTHLNPSVLSNPPIPLSPLQPT